MLPLTEPNKVTKIGRSKSPPTTPVEAGQPKPGGNIRPTKAVWRLKRIANGANPFLLLFVLIMMMPAGIPNLTGGNRDFNYRIPPSWSPEHESSYSFRAYMTDLSIWVMLTDLQPHQQCAAIVMRLGGSAREMARMITPQEMVNGGVQNGVAVDPVTYLMGALHQRFSALEEESRLTCMTEMLAFARRPGETINSLLARYETVRQRAVIEGQFVMSVEGCSLQILRAVGISSQQLFSLLQPFAGQLPTNDAQFNVLCTQLRRFGHITEGSPGNIASSLHGPPRQARPGSYLTDNQGTLREAAQNSPSMSSFFGNQQTGQDGHVWDNLVPAPPNPFDMWAAGGEGGTTDASQAYLQSGNSGGNRTVDTWGQMTSYPALSVDEDDSGTDTDTSSDDGVEDTQPIDITGMSEPDACEAVYLAYRRAKRNWRRFTGKPVRRFRRHFKRYTKTRYGKGRGKGRGFFWSQDDVFAYLKGKGKGHKGNTSGKGHGRLSLYQKTNPKGRDGKIMKCRRCNSEHHFERDCPQAKGGR